MSTNRIITIYWIGLLDLLEIILSDFSIQIFNQAIQESHNL